MQNPVVSMILGKDISKDDLYVINKWRIAEFNSETFISPLPDNSDWEKPYFFVKNNDILMSFGRLHTIYVHFHRSELYSILGISTVISIEKGKGYEKMIMTKMREYIKERNMTAIGFCNPSNSIFYEKCKYSIIKNGVRRFTFLNEDEKELPSKPGDIIYFEGREGLIEEMKKYANEKVTSYRSQW
jgi:hypothetical protein